MLSTSCSHLLKRKGGFYLLFHGIFFRIILEHSTWQVFCPRQALNCELQIMSCQFWFFKKRTMFEPFRMDLSKSGQWKAKNTSPLCLIGHMIAFWQQQNETSKFIIYSRLLSASDIRKYLVKFRWIRIEMLMHNKGFDPIVLNKKTFVNCDFVHVALLWLIRWEWKYFLATSTSLIMKWKVFPNRAKKILVSLR